MPAESPVDRVPDAPTAPRCVHAADAGTPAASSTASRSATTAIASTPAAASGRRRNRARRRPKPCSCRRPATGTGTGTGTVPSARRRITVPPPSVGRRGARTARCPASRRRPSIRSRWSTRSKALTVCRATASGDRPAVAPSASSRAGTSASEFACSVPAPPSWPVLSAARSSRSSAPRHSPTTSRSGRMRSASRSSASRPTRPAPSRFAWRASSETTCGCADGELGDVLDEDDALARRRLAEQRREQRRLARAARSGDEQVATRGDGLAQHGIPAPSSNMPARASAASGNPAARGTRTEMSVPAEETGGRTACTRMPRPSRTSTAGVASSMCRPPRATSCTARARTSASSADPGGLALGPGSAIDPEPVGAVDEEVGDRSGCRERRERPERRRAAPTPPPTGRATRPPTRRATRPGRSRGRPVARRPVSRSARRPAPRTASPTTAPRAASPRSCAEAAAGVVPRETDSRSHDGVATNGMDMRRA